MTSSSSSSPSCGSSFSSFSSFKSSSSSPLQLRRLAVLILFVLSLIIFLKIIINASRSRMEWDRPFADRHFSSQSAFSRGETVRLGIGLSPVTDSSPSASPPPPLQFKQTSMSDHPIQNEEEEKETESSSSSIDSPPPSSPSSPMLILSASATFVLTSGSNMSRFISHIEFTVLPSLNGYVSSSRIDSYYSHLEVRVPSPTLDTFLTSLRSSLETPVSLGRLVSQSRFSEDVTEQYTDTESRIKNLVVVKEQYEEIMKKANTIAEILAVQEHLRRVTQELEVYKGKRASMKSKIQYARVTIECRVEDEIVVTSPPRPPQFYEHIFDPASVFLSALRKVLIFTSLMLDGLITVVVFGIPLFALACVAWTAGRTAVESRGFQTMWRWLNSELGAGTEKREESTA